MLRKCTSVFVTMAMLLLLFVPLGVNGQEDPGLTQPPAETEIKPGNEPSPEANVGGASDEEALQAEEELPNQEAAGALYASSRKSELADTTFDFTQYDFSDPSKAGGTAFPTDEAFFGVWDESKGEFSTKGHINYDYVSSFGYDLQDVLAAVKEGDYETAKAAILKYYRDVINARGLEDIRSENPQAKFKADLLLQNFHYNPGGGEVADIFYLTKDYQALNINMTDQIKRIQSLGGAKMMNATVYAVNKDDYEAEFFSREAPSGGPELEVVINGTKVTFLPKFDGYVGAGVNRDTCFAATDPQRLLARESSIGNLNPVDDDTRRSYILFDLSRISDGDEISSATLKLTGKWNDKAETPRNDNDYQKRMTILVNQDSAWTETPNPPGTPDNVVDHSLRYANGDVNSYAYSYDGEDGLNWRQPDDNPAFRFEEELFRFSTWYDKLAITYRTTGDETYAQTAFLLLHDFIRKTYDVYRGMPGTIYETPKGDGNSSRLIHGGYSKGLDLHTRSGNLCLWIPHLINSEALTPELYTVFLKYMWSMGNVHSTYWTGSEEGNWGSAATTGFFRIICYYPEFAEIDAWNTILMKRLDGFNKTFLRNDRSSMEGSLAYTAYTLSTLLRNKTTADGVGVDYNISDSMRACVIDHAKFLIRMSGPGFTDSQYGDGSPYTTSYVDYLKQVGDWLKDPEVLWAAYGGEKGGKAPDFTSIFYPNAKQLALRSGWTKNDLFLYTNAKSADTFHEHWDDLGVIVSAYGEYLLGDPMHYTYNENDMSRRWLVSSRGHNTIEMNKHCQKSLNPSGMDTCLPLGGKQGEFQRMELNDSYDFTKMVTENYKNMSYRYDPSIEKQDPPVPTEVEPGMDASRSILFVRPNFWIVSDYMDPVDKTKVQTYEQLWHMKPGSNITIDGQYQLKPGESIGNVEAGELDSQVENTQFVPGTGNGTIRSNNVSKPNILVVPTSLENTEPKILRGLYAASGLTRTTYASIEKNVQGKTGMDAILFPTRANQDYQIDTTQHDLDDLPQGAGSSFEARIRDTSGVTNEDYHFNYYILHEEDKQTDVRFGNCKTDGTLAYYEQAANEAPRRVITQMGTYLDDQKNGYGVFKATKPVTDLAIEWNGDNIELTTSKPIDLAGSSMTILATKPVTCVTLNGKEISFKTGDKYIYFGEKPLLDGGTIIPPGGNDNSGGSSKPGTSGGSSHGGGGGGGTLMPPVIPPVTTPEPADPNASLKAELNGHWAQQEITTLIDQGIVTGSDGTLNLAANVTRAEYTVMLLRALGVKETPYQGAFTDVSPGDWYAGYFQTAVDNGILIGSDGRADPNGLLTREQAVKIMLAALETRQEVSYSGSSPGFADEGAISDWAKPYVSAAVSMGLINGMDGNQFEPSSNTPREQAMVMVYRTMQQAK